MAAKAWSFIYGFSAQNYYEAALQGLMTGLGSFSFGAVFALVAGSTDKTIFGNATFGTSGFGLRLDATGRLESACGTVEQLSGTALADADNTYGTNPEGNLLNNYKSLLQESSAPVGSTPLAWPQPRAFNIIHTHVNVDDDGNQDTYVNGRIVAQTAADVVGSSDPVRIGLSAADDDPSGQVVLLAGCYYHHTPLVGIPSLYATCLRAKDVFDGLSQDSIDYIWSVKRANLGNANLPLQAFPPTSPPYALGNWTSIGGANTPITMQLNGSLSTANLIGITELPSMWG